jgi:hypothetical protein
MDGLDAGTIIATLRLVDELSPGLQQAMSSTGDFKDALEESYAPVTALDGAMKQAASTATEAAVQQVALTTSVKTGGVATTEAAVAQTVFTAAALKSTDAATLSKQMMAEMTAAAEANRPATAAVAVAHTELSSVLAVAGTAWEALAVPLGLVTIAVAAFGPRLYELIGGWEGVKNAAREAADVLGDLGVILGAIGGHILNSVIEGVTATFSAVSTLGGAAVDAVKWFGDLLGVWDVIGSTYSNVRDGIHAIAGAFTELNEEIAKPREFEAPTVSFGIDATDIDAVSRMTAELDKQIVSSIRLNEGWGATYDEMKNVEGAIPGTEAEYAALGIVTDEVRKKQEAYTEALKNLYEQFSGGGALEKAQQYETTLRSIGGATHLTREEQEQYYKVFQTVIEKYELLGPPGAAVVAHFTDLASSVHQFSVMDVSLLKNLDDTSAGLEKMRLQLEALQSPMKILDLSALVEANSSEALIAGMTRDLQGFNSVLTITDEKALIASNSTDALLDDMAKKLAEMPGYVEPWQKSVESLGQSFLQLGSIFGGVTGDVLGFVGTLFNAFLTLDKSIDTIVSSFDQIRSSLSSGFSLSSFSGVLSGISSIVGAASAAISVFGALGSAIKRAFTDEETELVNPNRDLFMGQFVGQYGTDSFTAFLESLNQAIRIVYGVTTDTEAAVYGEPLYQQLQQADTYSEFKAAQLAIAELFYKAGATIDIFNEAGIGTAYQSSVFGSTTSPNFNITPTTDLNALQTQFTTGAQSAVYGAYTGGTTYGNSYFQSGSGSMSGSGMCIHVENMYVGGATGQQQASSFLNAIFDLVSGGGDALAKWRELNCAAAA